MLCFFWRGADQFWSFLCSLRVESGLFCRRFADEADQLQCLCQHQLKAKLLEAAGKEQSEAEAVQACRFLGCFVGVIILGVFIIVGVF